MQDLTKIKGTIDQFKKDTFYAVAYYNRRLEFRKNLENINESEVEEIFVCSEKISINGMFLQPWREVGMTINTVDFVDEIRPVNLGHWFEDFRYLRSFNCKNLNTSRTVNMDSTFKDCLTLKELDLSNLDTKKVRNMKMMFCRCLSLEQINLSHFDTENVTNMSNMFSNCRKLKTLDLNNFNTEQVKHVKGMFSACDELKSIRFGNFSTTNIHSYTQMFNDCDQLKSVYLPGFSAENAKYLYMFYKCPKLRYVDLPKFKLNAAISRTDPLFVDCPSLTDITVHPSVFEHLKHYKLLNHTPSLQNIKVVF